jgi:23S rRNA pseudouridine2605 synthase
MPRKPFDNNKPAKKQRVTKPRGRRDGSDAPKTNSRYTRSDDSKPSFKKEGGFSSERKPYERKARASFGDDKPERKSRPSFGTDKPERKPRSFDDKKDFGKDAFERKPRSFDSGEKKPYERKPRSFDSGEKKPFERKPRSFDSGGEKKPFERKTRSSDNDAPYERKSGRGVFGHEGEKRPPYARKPRTNSGDDKPFERKTQTTNGRDRKTFVRKSDGPDTFDSNGFERKTRSVDSGERKPYERKTRAGFGDDKKPFERRSTSKFPGADRKTYKKAGTAEFNAMKAYERKSALEKQKQEQREDDGTVRLNRYISNAGICSRREADVLIKSGAVKVNGTVVTEMGFRVGPDDVVNYGGETLRKEKPVYMLLNKPRDYITTTDDPKERRTVMALVNHTGPERLYPVGRLDRNTTGLLLLTNDGELAKKLTHPSSKIKKIYQVSLDKNLKVADYQALLEGVELEDGFIKPDAVEYVVGAEDKKEIGVELHSGRNRIVRRMFEHLGYVVVKLDRVTFAGLTKKDLARGRTRYLTDKEVGMLKML